MAPRPFFMSGSAYPIAHPYYLLLESPNQTIARAHKRIPLREVQFGEGPATRMLNAPNRKMQAPLTVRVRFVFYWFAIVRSPGETKSQFFLWLCALSRHSGVSTWYGISLSKFVLRCWPIGSNYSSLRLKTESSLESVSS